MAKPMTKAQWIAQAKKWGVPLNVVGNPETHNRNKQGAWGDVNGFVWHHFGSVSPDKTDLPLIVNGYKGLPGPLSQLFLGDDNIVDLVSTGRCNHAGKGTRAVLDAVISEDYAGTLVPGRDEVDFNSRFYGMEIGYSGTEWMGDERYKNALLISAAICDFHGWSAKSVIAHHELTKRKWDPGFKGQRYDMGKVRKDIQILLDAGPKNAEATVKPASVPIVPSSHTVTAAPAAPAGVDTSKAFGQDSTYRDSGVYGVCDMSNYYAAEALGVQGETGEFHGARREVWAVESALLRLKRLEGRYAADYSAGTSTRDALNKYFKDVGKSGINGFNQLMWDSGIRATWTP